MAPCARSSTDRASDYGSEGWGFESLRARKGLLASENAGRHAGRDVAYRVHSV
jgi:hypothetical protein